MRNELRFSSQVLLTNIGNLVASLKKKSQLHPKDWAGRYWIVKQNNAIDMST